MVDSANGSVKARIVSTETHDFVNSPHCREHLVPFLKWLLRRHKNLDGVTEIRAIADRPAKMVWSGYFGPGHVRDLLEQILPDPDGPRPKIPYGDTPRIGEAQFYFSMQPADKALLARSAYALGRCEGTADRDVIAYHLFAVDVDPVRPSGISATDEEKAEALVVTRKVGRWFQKRDLGFISADSGNGYHLLIPTTPYTDVAQASANAHTLLQLLKKKFSTDKVSIDTTIANPARILKLYGTKAVKGSDIPERPHRYATVDLSNIPEDVDLFGVLHKELGDFREASTPVTRKPSPKKTSPRSKPLAGESWDFDTCSKILESLLTRAGLDFKAKDKDGHRIFNFRDCPHHTDPDGQHYECAVMARAEGGFAAKCMHDEGAGWKDFKTKIAWDEHIGEVLDELGIPRTTGPYQATTSGIVRFTYTKEGVVKVPVTNFTAKITRDVVEDDGVETRHVFEIEANLRGRGAHFSISASDFMGMGWVVEHLGPEAVVFAGQGNKDHARAAIQLLSGEVPTEQVYTHLGWRKHGDQ